MRRILLVDDEPDLQALLVRAFSREGFDTRHASTGREALAACAQDPPPDLVLLDWNLPDLPGPEVFRRLRLQPRTAQLPVLMVTGRDEAIDRVVGLELGVDDYVVKPYSVRELVLRAKAVLRRCAPPASARPPVLRVGGLTLDLLTDTLRVGDQAVPLTAHELRVLQVLMRHPGRVFSRAEVLREAWGDDLAITERTVDTHITRIRKKLGDHGRQLLTRRGVGYLLEP